MLTLQFSFPCTVGVIACEFVSVNVFVCRACFCVIAECVIQCHVLIWVCRVCVCHVVNVICVCRVCVCHVVNVPYVCVTWWMCHMCVPNIYDMSVSYMCAEYACVMCWVCHLCAEYVRRVERVICVFVCRVSVLYTFVCYCVHIFVCSCVWLRVYYLSGYTICEVMCSICVAVALCVREANVCLRACVRAFCVCVVSKQRFIFPSVFCFSVSSRWRNSGFALSIW